MGDLFSEDADMRRKMKCRLSAIYRQQVRFWCRLLSTHEDELRCARRSTA